MIPQSQIALGNESSKQFLNTVTPHLFPSQHSPNSYSIISISEIDFVISKVFAFHGKNKLRVAMTKYLESVSARDGGVSEELRLLLAYLAPSTSQ